MFDITVCDLVSVLVQVRICANTGAPFRNLEPLSVLHYAAGEEATEHFDFVDPLTENYEHVLAKQGERDVTFLLYLNDDYDGGETEMPEIGFSHKGRRGGRLLLRERARERQARPSHAARGTPAEARRKVGGLAVHT